MMEDMNRREFIGRSTTSTVGLAAGLAILTDADPAGVGEPERRNYKPDRMTYRRLGKTNMMVSVVSLGASANYGEGQWADRNPSAYRAMLEELLELGVNYFDTSTFDYSTSSGYETEDDLACLCTSANRDKMVISDDGRGLGIRIFRIPRDPRNAAKWSWATVDSSPLHGPGIGGLNVDGRLDVVSDFVWYEQGDGGKWTKHPLPAPTKQRDGQQASDQSSGRSGCWVPHTGRADISMSFWKE